MTHEAAAKAVGRSRSAVTNLLRLTHAREARAGLPRRRRARDGTCARVARPRRWREQGGAAARVVDERVVGARDGAPRAAAAEPPRKRDGARRRASRARHRTPRDSRTSSPSASVRTVRIEPGRKGAGRIVIRYGTLDELDGIVAEQLERAELEAPRRRDAGRTRERRPPRAVRAISRAAPTSSPRPRPRTSRRLRCSASSPRRRRRASRSA